jgi:ribosomal protein S18 acetylase RimI-like enzyme
VTIGVSLRAAEPSDEPFLAQLLAQVRATEFGLLPAALAGTLLAQQREAQRLSIAGRPEGSEEIVVDETGIRVGRLATARDDDALRLVDVTVEAAHRGRGIGSHLVRLVLQRAATEQLAVILRVDHRNPAARRLYEREGFVEVGRDQLDAFLRRDVPAAS